MLPVEKFRRQPPEFWALVKLVSQELKYSERAKRGAGPGRVKRYSVEQITVALENRGLDAKQAAKHVKRLAAYSNLRADLLEDVVEPSMMNRDQAAKLFKKVRARVKPPETLDLPRFGGHDFVRTAKQLLFLIGRDSHTPPGWSSRASCGA